MCSKQHVACSTGMINTRLQAVYSVGMPYHCTLYLGFFLLASAPIPPFPTLTTHAPPLCVCHADGGAVVIQRREDGSVDFDQTWEKYKKGFGDLQRKQIFKMISLH